MELKILDCLMLISLQGKTDWSKATTQSPTPKTNIRVRTNNCQRLQSNSQPQRWSKTN